MSTMFQGSNKNYLQNNLRHPIIPYQWVVPFYLSHTGEQGMGGMVMLLFVFDRTDCSKAVEVRVWLHLKILSLLSYYIIFGIVTFTFPINIFFPQKFILSCVVWCYVVVCCVVWYYVLFCCVVKCCVVM